MINNYSITSHPILPQAKVARRLSKKIKGWVMQQGFVGDKLLGEDTDMFVIQVIHPESKALIENEIEGIKWKKK